MESENSQQPEKKFSLTELLQLLQEGKLPGGGEGYKLFDISSQPDLQGDFSFGPSGFPEVGFGQKFETDFKGWEHGERVRTKYLVVKQEDALGNLQFGLQVANSVVGDTRHADTFILESPTPEEQAALSRIGMGEIEAVVEVKNKLNLESETSNMQDYSARIDRIIEVQQPWDGNPESLKDEKSVLIEGEIVEYSENREYPYNEAKVIVKMKNGQLVPIKLWNGYLNIADGVIENFLPQHPITGDVVQISTTYGNPNMRYGRAEEPHFSAFWCRSTFLIAPEAQRQQINETQREFVANSLAAIEQATSPQQVRELIGSLIKASFITNTDLNLTRAEKKKINHLISTKISDDAEKPLLLFKDMSGMEGVRKGYGIDVYSVNRNEYAQFCLQVARGEIEMIENTDPSYPWRIMEDNLSEEQQKHILLEAIAHFYRRVIGKKTIWKKEVLVDPQDLPDLQNKLPDNKKKYDPVELADSNNVKRDDEYLFDQTLGYFSHKIGADCSQVYILMVRNMHNLELFMQTSEDRLKNFYEYALIEAMSRNAQHNIIWKDDEWGTVIVGLKDVAAAKAYLNEFELFYKLAIKLAVKGWKNNGMRQPETHITEFLEVLKDLDLYLKQSTAALN